MAARRSRQNPAERRKRLVILQLAGLVLLVATTAYIVYQSLQVA
ncbi:hypothetical protein [Nocardioides sp. cx-169]|nr:hypothetical protein [Nocardioides sp. cx-169]